MSIIVDNTNDNNDQLNILFRDESEVNHYEKFKMIADLITNEEFETICMGVVKREIDYDQFSKLPHERKQRYKRIHKGGDDMSLMNYRFLLFEDLGITTDDVLLKGLIQTDRNLNNIKISLFDKRHDKFIELLRTKLNSFSWSQSDTVCTMKHFLKYRIANCVPVITNNLMEAHGNKYEHFRA